MKTTVVHCMKARFDVYIGRAAPRRGLPASLWANPFKIGPGVSREDSIELYRQWVNSALDPEARWIKEHVHELKGKILGCWCSPKACHGDVLARMAEEQP